jgi:hypothetical protein
MGFCAGARSWLIKTQSTQQKLVQLADAAAPDFPECPLHQWYKNKRERQQSTRPGDAAAARPEVRDGENGAVRAVSALAASHLHPTRRTEQLLVFPIYGRDQLSHCVVFFPNGEAYRAGITTGERTGGARARGLQSVPSRRSGFAF